MQILPSNWNVKDWLQALAWIAAAVGAVVAAAKFLAELRLAREQRDRDLRWKQAEAGKSLNDEMLEDKLAMAALRMLDDDGRSFLLPSNRKVIITHADVRRALDVTSDVLSEDQKEEDQHILDCFDSLFYYMSTLEHNIRSSLVLPEDVAFPLDYYVSLLPKFVSVVDPYLTKYDLWQASAFLDRYSAWTESVADERIDGQRTAPDPANGRDGRHSYRTLRAPSQE